MAPHTSRLSIASILSLLICFGATVNPTGLIAQGSAKSSQETIPAIDTVDLVMFDDPSFEYPSNRYEIPSEPTRVWKRALERESDSALLRLTMDTVAIAKQLGMEGLEEFPPIFAKFLQNDAVESSVRRSAVAALIKLDSREHAELLADQSSRFGETIAVLVEPALARWESNVLQEQWLERVSEASSGRRSLIRAMEGLGALNATDASEPLIQLVESTAVATGVRLAAARAVGLLDFEGQLELANRLVALSEDEVLSGIMAVAVLDDRDDSGAVNALKKLVARESTAVQAEALRALYEVDPLLPLEFGDAALQSPDVNVRRPIARSMVYAKDAKWMASIASLLNDVNPSLRREVAASMVYLANEHDLRDEAVAEASRVIARDDWRGCEQATIVLVNLDEKVIGDRLVQLMEHPRGEVQVTAGWGLRRIGVKEHLPAMLRRAQSLYSGFRSKEISLLTPGAEPLITQLFMAFGQMRYNEAEGLIRKYIPKDFSLGDNSRAAATWAIGLIYEGKAPPDITQRLVERLNDVNSLFAEIGDVRGMAAVSLGRMKSESAIGDLRKYMLGDGMFPDQACGWAIEKLTGEPKPPVREGILSEHNNWFLAPLKQKKE